MMPSEPALAFLPHPRVAEIQAATCAHYDLALSDMVTPRRARDVAQPRQLAMFLARALTSRSLPEIGRVFGNRDHTTVMHAVRVVAERIRVDPEMQIAARRIIAAAAAMTAERLAA